MYKLSLSAVSLAALTIGASSVLAAPIEYEGSATIFDGGVTNTDDKLSLFLSEVPMPGDQVSFKATYDPDTVAFAGTGAPLFPDTNFFTGGITSIEFTIGSTTLMAVPTAPEEAGVLATTATTDQVGIPFFTDGYSITVGSPLGQPRWAANLFFFNSTPDLPNANAPDGLPDFNNFEFAGFGLRVFADTDTTTDSNPASFGSLLDDLAIADPPAPPPPPPPPGPPPPPPPGPPTPPPPTPIPEPSSLALLGAGLAGLGLSRRRKKAVL